MIGKTFGHYTVLSAAPRVRKKAQYLCRCVCGTERVVDAYKLKSGISRSCGCMRAAYVSESKTIHGHSKSGAPDSPEYQTWCSMIKRCRNSNATQFKWYGERGISVCDRWVSGCGGKTGFELFLQDMGSRPSGTSIDRIDVDGNYEPSNCRWATPTEQAHNKRQKIGTAA